MRCFRWVLLENVLINCSAFLAFELIKIIKENELDYHPIIVHVIGSDGAMIYAKMHELMQHYIHGAIIESLPSESSNSNLVRFYKLPF